MGNNSYKKSQAKRFNENRKHQLEQDELLRIDKLENPEKYKSKSSRAARHHARLWAAIGLTATSVRAVK